MKPDDVAEIQKFREKMGIPIAIDRIVKSYGIEYLKDILGV